VIEHEDNLIFDLLSQLLALAWHDGIFAPEIREIEGIYTHPIPPHRRGMELRIDREWWTSQSFVSQSGRQTVTGRQGLNLSSLLTGTEI
jgi:hypothetical protein